MLELAELLRHAVVADPLRQTAPVVEQMAKRERAGLIRGAEGEAGQVPLHGCIKAQPTVLRQPGHSQRRERLGHGADVERRVTASHHGNASR